MNHDPKDCAAKVGKKADGVLKGAGTHAHPETCDGAAFVTPQLQIKKYLSSLDHLLLPAHYFLIAHIAI
jgi:hypothetical protein